MKIYLNRITGIDDAMVSLLMSKRSWTREKESEIRDLVWLSCERRGFAFPCGIDEYKKRMDTLIKYGRVHTTLLRYIDFSITVNGLHRAGQDDWDSHAWRFDNRIVRASTRLANFKEGEMSDFYKGKIIPTDMALTALGITTPDKIEYEGKTYVKAVNGYILEECADDNDVKRGLYMLSIPSDFIFKINLTEWAHVYKMRNNFSTANPEVRECCERIADLIEKSQPHFNRNLLMEIPN